MDMESERNSGSSCSNNNGTSSTNNSHIVEVVDKLEQEVMLPGFRFHPTDEELVGFYLKRKIQLRPLSIELIKQLDIYKYDPWDLPKMAATGEKEWYFFCPRDRKYRNSARPNRVTGAGFWKATGTDRPIYSSEGNKCIGLKKSLVFYKGRAAKGMKTDWMMHEFRLPSLADGHHQYPPSSAPASKRFVDRTIPPNDAWAICRIFKKTNSTTQRALSQSWVSPLVEEAVLPTSSTWHDDDHLVSRASLFQPPHCFSQIHNMPLNSATTETTTTSSFPPIHHHFNHNTNITTSNHQIHHFSPSNNNYSSLDFYSAKPINNIPLAPKPSYHLHSYPFSMTGDPETSANFSSPFTPPPPMGKCTLDLSSMLLNMSSSPSPSILLGDFKQHEAGGGGGDCESMSSMDQFSSRSQHSNSNGGGGISSLISGSHELIQVGGGMHRHQGSDDHVHGDHHHNPASIMVMKSPDFAQVDALPFSYLGENGSTPTAAWKQNLLLWDYVNPSPPFSSGDSVASTFSTTKCYN